MCSKRQSKFLSLYLSFTVHRHDDCNDVDFAYGLISLVVMGWIASEGIDEQGNVYDETALTCGFGIGLIWPISLFAFGISAILPTLGRTVNQLG